MRTFIPLAAVCLLSACSPNQGADTLKPILLEQLRNSYDNKNWYVSLKYATEGITAEQANWKDSTGNHSIGELVSHLIFWNERNLANFRGDSLEPYSGDNDATFQKYTSAHWSHALARLDSIQTEIYKAAENASDEQLLEWRSDLANIASHNAYHTGQIIYIRKLKGWWREGQGL